MASRKRTKIQGSTRPAPKGAKRLTKADDAETMEVTLRLRSKNSTAALDRLVMRLSAKPPKDRRYLTRDELQEKYGAAEADIRSVNAFAHAHGLTVTEVHRSSRIVKLRGPLKAVREAFAARVSKLGAYRVRQGAISIPAALAGIVLGVHGIDNRPVAKPHLRRSRTSRKALAGSFKAGHIAQLYKFPARLTGKDQCIAIIEFNAIDSRGRAVKTGYSHSDLKHFFRNNRVKMPVIVPYSVDGGSNIPGRKGADDDEVTLDIEMAAAIAPGARYVVYFAPNTTAGFINAIKAAVHDDQNNPTVISVSWGGAEDDKGYFAAQYLEAVHETLRDAAALGITVCIAAGDDGSPDVDRRGWDNKPHVDFPASSPFALACGGTSLKARGKRITSEVVWNRGPAGGAGGGGVSNYFALPTYQKRSHVPRSTTKQKCRGVPDLAGVADPYTGFQYYLYRRTTTCGGTSGVAPIIAGLIARINEHLMRSAGKTVGFINPQIYGGNGPKAFRDIRDGNNDIFGLLGGQYQAGIGWDACTGLGVPDGRKLLALLT